MCGSISYRADIAEEASACHCDMCRQWTGSAFIAVAAKDLVWTSGEDDVQTFASSAWAERQFCPKCGSCLIYRITAEGPYHGHTTVGLGTLDDTRGIGLVREFYIDKKPETFSFEGERNQLTQAQVEAMFGGS